MDPNHTPATPHDFTPAEIQAATVLARAMAARFPPTYYTQDFQPHFWVVAAIAEAIRQVGRHNRFAQGAQELAALDQTIEAQIMAFTMPEPMTAASLMSWHEVLTNTVEMIEHRTTVLNETAEISLTPPPPELVHRFCRLRTFADAVLDAMTQAGYSGGPISDALFVHLLEAVNPEKIIREVQEKQARDEVPKEAMDMAEQIQRELSETLGAEVRVHAVVMGGGQTGYTGGVVTDLIPPVGSKDEKEGSGNGSVH